MTASKKNTTKQIFFRTDGNDIIGYRHFDRCFVLAKKLKSSTNEIFFICRHSSANLEDLVHDAGFGFKLLHDEIPETPYGEIMPQRIRREDAASTIRAIEKAGKADLLIIDHYGIDNNWQRPVKKSANKIAVIDDIVNRAHNCDFFIDTNHLISPENDDEAPKPSYDNLLNQECTVLNGLSFALIDDEYAKKIPARKLTEVNKILLNLEGISVSASEILLKYLTSDKFFNIDIDIIDRNSDEDLQNLCEKYANFNYYNNISDMAERMVSSDVFIGSDMFVSESLSRGLAPIVIAQNSKLHNSLEALHKEGIVQYIFDNFSKQNLIQLIDNVLEDKQWRKQAGMLGKKLVDGKGAAKVAAELLKIK